ncbi:MAG: head maturation protease, ClpP-related [Oryzomonas sp.]
MGTKETKFWSIKNQGIGSAQVFIYDQIGVDWWTGEGIEANSLCMQIAALNVNSIDVYISSPGGSFHDGMKIYNTLKRHPAFVTTFNDSEAASIASVLFLAGDRRVAAPGSNMMIHLPSVEQCSGTADDLRKAADYLDVIRDSLVGIYRGCCSMTDAEILSALEAETYYSAEQALEIGFATEIGEQAKIAALKRTLDPKALGYRNPPRVLNAATVNGPGKVNALHLVQEGKIDRASDWSFTADDGNKILGDPKDWNEYAKWFLGTDASAAKETKAYYKYPFGKDGKVFRSGVIAAKERAAQQGESEVEAAAGHILEEIDKGKDKAENHKKTVVRNGVTIEIDPDDPNEDDPEEQDCYSTGHVPATECADCGARDSCINPLNSAASAAITTASAAGKTEVQVMTQHAAPADGATPRDFNKEAMEIITMCKTSGCLDKAQEYIAAKLTPEQAGLKVLDLFHSGAIASPAAEAAPIVDLGKAAGQFSYTKAIAMMANQRLNNEKPSGLEWEVHQDLAKKAGNHYTDRGGILIPQRVTNSGDSGRNNAVAQATMALRGGNTNEALRILNTALTSTGSTTGAAAVFQEYGEFIDILRNMMVATRMGARVLTGLKGPINFPKQTGASTLYWTGENPGTDVTQSNTTFGTVTLSPKTCQAQGALSRQLIIESTPDIEGIVRNDLAMIHALGWDYTSLHGTGSNNQPTGIYNMASVNAVAMGGVPTYPKIVSMITAVATFNALLGKCGFVTNPLMSGLLMTTLKFPTTANGTPIWEGKHVEGVMAGYDAISSNQILANMGSGSNEVGMVFGNWDDLMIGMWGALELLVDPYSLAGQGLLKITSFQMIDIASRRPQSFAKATGATVS